MEKVIFIDRDGVINKDPGGWTPHSYVTRWEDFIFLPGSLNALKNLTDAGYGIVVISNQGGISKGFYSEQELKAVSGRMEKEINRGGARLARVYYCIHQNSDNCTCRKPKTGLIEQAEQELGVAAKGAYFVGDGRMDVEAGEKMEMKTVLVLSGKSALADVATWDVKPDFIFDDLKEATDFIIDGGGR